MPSEADALGPSADALLRWMGERAGVEVERRSAPSYEALADEVRAGAIDVAWLPPIVFVRLGEAAQALGSICRDGKTTYEAALIVRAGDKKLRTIEALRGTRAGWVDPWSAAGFVLPRVKLALLGVDPRTVFRTERFYGSHRAAIEALRDGACDAAGTHARADEKGKIVSGGWSSVEGADVRVLATFGAIPPDVIAVRSAFDATLREKTLSALRDACKDAEGRELTRAIFGGDELREGLAPGYESLKRALEMATARGLFD